jgi:hypothetical protein
MQVKASRLWLESLGITDAVSSKASEVCAKVPTVEVELSPVQVETT